MSGIILSATRPLVLLLVLISGACARGANETRLHADLQARLNEEVKPGLFEVVGVRREGSAPLATSHTGAERVVVYFNATLRLAEDYRFGEWNQLGPSSVAYVLGATEKGVFGLKPENHAGDFVRVYGSAVYEQGATGWVLGATEPATVAAAPNIDGSAPPSRSKQLIDRLAQMVELPPPGVPVQEDEIIADELARASENIERRVKRREHTFTLATGPEQGEYARFGAALVSAINEAAPHVQLRHRPSEGSVDNAWLLSRGEADYAIVQGDVAAAAYAGTEVFARGGPLTSLRAVGGLFPEAIHVVVLADSPIRDIKQLRGRRVAIGAPASGTRFDAVSVLAAHGLEMSDLAEASEDTLADALARLQGKELDAVFHTGAAPARVLQQFAIAPGMRLLSIDDAVRTAAATALLLTTVEAPPAEVQRVSDLIFSRMSQPTSGRSDIVRVSTGGELRGVTIPLHTGAAREPQ